MVERQLPKLHTRVRFPSPAPFIMGRLRSEVAREGEPRCGSFAKDGGLCVLMTRITLSQLESCVAEGVDGCGAACVRLLHSQHCEALDGTFEDPSHEVMVETLGVTLYVAKRILAWHTKAAVRKAEKIEDLQSFTTCAVG